MPADAKDRIASSFRSAPHDLHQCHRKPIVDPKWEVPLPGIACRIGDAVSDRDVGLLPVAAPLDQSEDNANDSMGGGMQSNPQQGREPSP